MKATAVAPSNIAFIKFLGKVDDSLRLPANNSISMCLSAATTTTTVEFSPFCRKDKIEIQGEYFAQEEKKRISQHLDRIRKIVGFKTFARVVTQNSFPKSSGIASSASGFAALTLAGTKAAGLSLSEKKLSVLARLASGSACRSIPDGFVEWRKAETSNGSYAYSLYPANYWDVRDILVVLEEKAKTVSSTATHKQAPTSPFYRSRIEGINSKITRLKQALAKRDFTSFGKIVEAETLNMHAVIMTAHPPIFYWTDKTVKLIQSIWRWRKKGLPVYFTIDAGPNIHLLCEGKNIRDVLSQLMRISGIKQTFVNSPSNGAKLVNKHLF